MAKYFSLELQQTYRKKHTISFFYQTRIDENTIIIFYKTDIEYREIIIEKMRVFFSFYFKLLE